MKSDNSEPQFNEKSEDGQPDGFEFHHGMPIPRHMTQPGQDGWRTPTFEDYERDRAERVNRGHGLKEKVESSNESPSSRPQSSGRLGVQSVAKLAEQLDHGLEKLHWRIRIRHFTWNFFSMTMATGGIANVLYTVPFRFPGLYAIGCIFFLFNIVLFLINVVMISLRFYTFHETFRASYMHPSERLFLPASVVSFGTILINISQYGLSKSGPWLDTAVQVLFWLYATLAILASSGIYLL
ncbi:MAG: hypothetical protein Q9174_007093, partial [Haloplaca sp. 1 TL-2023]